MELADGCILLFAVDFYDDISNYVVDAAVPGAKEAVDRVHL
jgi:HSP20 family molecular chaperone IbpA